MILKSLKVTNSRGIVLTLAFEDISTGFVVKEIEGLDPVHATLVSSSFANTDGEQYQSSRREKRNIKIHLDLMPDYAFGTVKELRDKLYEFFMPKTSIKMTFGMYDKFSESLSDRTLDLDIDGRIESFDSALFVQEPSADISIICFNPDFQDPTPVIFNGETVSTGEETLIQYEGNVETGVIFTLLVDRYVNVFDIYHRTPEGMRALIEWTWVESLQDGDILKISSIPGSKSVTRTRDSIEIPFLYSITPQSGWIELQPGENYIRVFNSEGAPIPYTLEYNNKYGGL